MTLDIETMRYLDEKFTKLHERVNDVIVDVNEAKSQTCGRLSSLEAQYKSHVKQQMDKEGRKYKYMTACMTFGLGVLGLTQGINIFG